MEVTKEATAGLTEPTPKCDVLGCTNDATVHPVLLLRQSRHHDHEIRACLKMIKICWGCSRHAKVSDFLPPEMWNQLRSLFIAKGKLPPKLQLTRLDTTPLGSEEASKQGDWT